MTAISQPQTPAFQITFGASEARLTPTAGHAKLSLPMPHLGGVPAETLGGAEAAVRWEEPFLLAESDSELVGAVLVDASGRLEDKVEDAYSQLLKITDGWSLYRVWNYIPQINAIRGGLERYRQFNIGRWAAFEQHFGKDHRAFMPAASAVGIGGDQLVILFKAGRTPPSYFENPSQVPAYHYPADYGPRPPGFARGVRINHTGSSEIYLSGTASIEGHQTVGEGDWATQFKTTLHNVQIMLKRMQAEAALSPAQWAQGRIKTAHFKCYLREPESTALVQDWLLETLGSHEHFTFVQSEICRANLDIEIEAAIEANGTEAP